MEDFISTSAVKTPACEVIFRDQSGWVYSRFAAPAGFQLDKYLMHTYPDHTIINDHGKWFLQTPDGDIMTVEQIYKLS